MSVKNRFKISFGFSFVGIATASAILASIIIFLFFRKLESNEDKKITYNIQTLLRNEVNLRNTYALSKSLVDLENIGIFKCASLKEENNKFTYYDTISFDNCGRSYFIDLRIVKTELKAQSGFVYQFNYIKNINYFSLIVEISSYLILILFLYLFKNYVKTTENKMKTRLKIFEIEKKLLQDHAKQISHDVASPLSAIKMVVELIKNIDPEVKEVLLSSVERTQSIFDDLKNEKNNRSAAVDVVQCLKQIIAEKNTLWLGECYFDINLSKLDFGKVVADEETMKRIFSNLLNNSYESMKNINHKKISILIQNLDTYVEITIRDVGKGIPSEVLPKIGTKGFSYDKQDHSTAGSGLGLYSAIQFLKGWGGDLVVTSKLNVGTTITLKLKTFES